ncbi:unnamed protein product [Colletotrichum noveboracense]|uniref:Uncharacterized protein n=1 Tax=Colletotrichum noveboracense TaxID=2664923 RepID=A0A9W4S0H5_9PEZI|nr:hypothetical protein K456DRAFT_1717243 [Colletotrichum gloeosporioides 23]KAJ0283690.1 hypothetical protein COL940_004472 [Colletotrichum noveboracense]KAJ0284998.1 hypothetical protein CBS470a_006589 [Colletotrichum nupharicola]KAJ0312822.1 hypothetical protein Brms1b_007671 [Colletotrichum noveboracense]CAI0650666.1 unnamed protein product [Colletotrichum noveboracense]
MSRITTQRLIAAAPCLRSASIAHAAPRAVYFHARHSSSLPTVAQSDFWKGLIPKPFRREPQLPGDPSIKRVKSKKKKEWNPATFYIVIFLLIGSMSINMLSSKQSFEAFSRQADVRIGVLKEVVEKIQRGEKVDVEEALGTGDPQKELEWEEMLREIEREDVSRQKKQEKSRQTESVKSKPEKEARSHSTGVSEAAKPPARGMSSFF